MFYYIEGALVLTDANTAVLDVGGVGYKLTVSGTTLGKLTAHREQPKARLYTYLAVREDAIELYGFYTTEELAVFKMLLSVSGIGAKTAIAILTQMRPEAIALAVTSSDAKAIAKAPGVGPKTAARIVLELKDKIAKELTPAEDLPAGADEGEITGAGLMAEAEKALMVLGYTRQEAAYGLKGLGKEEMGLEDMIKEALKRLMKS